MGDALKTKIDGLKKVQSCSVEPLDVTNRESVQQVYEQIAQTRGGINVVINCAGVMYFTLMKNQEWKHWADTLAVNCGGTMNSCGAALPHLLKAVKSDTVPKNAHLVNISS